MKHVPTPNTRARWDSCPVQLSSRDADGNTVGGPYPVRPAYAHDLDEWLERHPVWVIEKEKSE